ncbi:NADH oxidase [Thiocapsa imhoffii]|uniref:NADH oxidase n=1 Tax=Thiocapsa imhoffii TaxID=382777 RepID=A0A9X0WKE5_9GAMM|nr:FAD-dependent oxidoreductase [Thiocapsa imhoffii]MBK1646080.1 NADH oxidase [Thiocapsa imhoffii]
MTQAPLDSPAVASAAADQAPTILIVGGVAGGASAAARARRVNEHARIVMFERDAEVSFANCGLPYYIGGEIQDRSQLLVATPALFRERFRIDARVRHEVESIDRVAKTVRVRNLETGEVYHESYDKLILSPGAAPIVPPIPGVNTQGVFTLRNIDDMDRIVEGSEDAREVVVVGAGYIGLEIAEQFAHKGPEVTIVELQDQVMPFFDREIAEPLHRELERNGVRLELGRGIATIEETNGVVSGVTLTDGTRLAADLVLMSVGVRPNIELAVAAGLAIGDSGGIATDDFMRTSDPDIYAVGDAAEYRFGPTGARQRVPLAGIANRTGRVAGEHAATGRSRPAPAAWSTSVVRVFGYAAGIAGLSRVAARQAGFDARAVHIVSYHHASYYPGAAPLGIKLVYENGTGRVLGAQVMGAAGVDKRLDVVATLIHFQGTIDDLASLDLAYAPPFGSAKDPLHMAAFVAQNDLDGLSPLVAPDADLSDFQVVDVREAAEREELPLCDAPHAKHIRLDDLRDRLGELDPSLPTLVSCRSGQRAYAGVRILAQHGFAEVYNLSGAAAMRDFARNRRSGMEAKTPVKLPRPEHLVNQP